MTACNSAELFLDCDICAISHLFRPYNCQLFSKQFGVDKSKIAKVFVCCPSYDKAVSIGYKRTRAYQHQRSRFSTVIFSSACTRSYVNFHDAHQDKTLTNICKRKMKCLPPSPNANCGCPTFIHTLGREIKNVTGGFS